MVAVPIFFKHLFATVITKTTTGRSEGSVTEFWHFVVPLSGGPEPNNRLMNVENITRVVRAAEAQWNCTRIVANTASINSTTMNAPKAPPSVFSVDSVANHT